MSIAGGIKVRVTWTSCNKNRGDFSAVRQVPEAEIHMYAQQTYGYKKKLFHTLKRHEKDKQLTPSVLEVTT